MTGVPNSAPYNTYSAAAIFRPAALVPGMRVTLLLARDASVGSDGTAIYVVSDQQDKRGNPLLVNRDTGAAITASPDSVWAGY